MGRLTAPKRVKQTSSISPVVVAIERQTVISSHRYVNKTTMLGLASDNIGNQCCPIPLKPRELSFGVLKDAFWSSLSQEETINIVRYAFTPFRRFVVHWVTKAKEEKDQPETWQFAAKLYSSLYGEDSEERLASSSPSILQSVPRPIDLTSFGVVSIRCEASILRLIRQSVFVDEELKRSFAAREFSNFWKFDKNSSICVGIF